MLHMYIYYIKIVTVSWCLLDNFAWSWLTFFECMIIWLRIEKWLRFFIALWFFICLESSKICCIRTKEIRGFQGSILIVSGGIYTNSFYCNLQQQRLTIIGIAISMTIVITAVIVDHCCSTVPRYFFFWYLYLYLATISCIYQYLYLDIF